MGIYAAASMEMKHMKPAMSKLDVPKNLAIDSLLLLFPFI